MHVFNTLLRAHEEFTPTVDNEVKMYVCGLTPYDSTHIGHARTYVSFDVIKRYLLKKGYIVYHIQNITDVDDKIIARCKESGKDPKELTESIHNEAFLLFGKLNILPADIYPKVTTHIDVIIDLISKLLSEKKAYITDSGVYFDISTFPNYGKLSNQDMSQIKNGVRIELDETKKNPEDFALWKKTNGEIIEFDSPFGKGRPGWHIECSAMAGKYAKGTLDIHGGAKDLIFPHHENEIAQAEAATGGKYCKYWLHTGFLTVNGEKMSKSLGNFITINDALQKSKPNTLRLFFLQAHYRSPLDYDVNKISNLNESVERIFNSKNLIDEALKKSQKTDDEFRSKTNRLIDSFYMHMDKDFNTPESLADLFSLLRIANNHISNNIVDIEQLKIIQRFIDDALWIFGLIMNSNVEMHLEKLQSLAVEFGIDPLEKAENILDNIIDLRQKARADKDYKKSDLIRKKLSDIGLILEDNENGARWKIQ